MAKTKKSGAGRAAANEATGRSTARKAGIATFATIGALAAGAFAALKFGLVDRLTARGDGGEHAAPDLAPDAPTPGTTRAPEAFRPDPTAPVPASERASIAPAIGTSTSFTVARPHG